MNEQDSNIQIYDFLPKYPLVQPYSDTIFNPYNESLASSIYNKAEFNPLPLIEGKPTKGEFLKHQINTQRYMSPHTPYMGILLLQGLGSGKTCTAVAIAQYFRRIYEEQGIGLKKALVLARGKTLLDNFKNELVNVCTTGEYIPDDVDTLTPQKVVTRTNKLIKEFYSLKTFDKIMKELSLLSDQGIIEQYSDTLVIIDEVHNLRIIDETSPNRAYIQIYRLLHTANNIRAILMSGTPMQDTPQEIASVLNLILPEKYELPIGSVFKTEYLERNNDNIWTIKPSMRDRFRSRIVGRISYLRRVDDDRISVVYQGQVITPPLLHTKVVNSTMSEFQSSIYRLAFESDGGKSVNISDNRPRTGFYSHSIQANLFVYPDGSFGTMRFNEVDGRYVIAEGGFNTFLEKTIFKSVRSKKQTKTRYIAKDILFGSVKNASEEDKLSYIQNHSSIYHTIIRGILNTRDKLRLVYIELVDGSGAILFANLLKLFGYEESIAGAETTPRKRFALLTGKTVTSVRTQNVLKTFNSKENMHGEYIHLIIGSKIIGEGLSLKNVQEIDIATADWNYASIEQVIARGIRAFSHDDLIQEMMAKGIEGKIQVNVYQHIATPISISGTPDLSISVNLRMYNIAEKKDISIKHIERFLKENSFDCLLNYNRNQVQGVDGSRECEYSSCQYTCNGLVPSTRKIDDSTYKLYYSKQEIGFISQEIKTFFRHNFSVPLTTLIEMIIYNDKNIPVLRFNILSVISQYILQEEPLYDRYGFEVYLKESQGILYLVRGIGSSVDKPHGIGYYTEYPIARKKKDLAYYIGRIEEKDIRDVINSICRCEKIEANMKSLDINIVEAIIEAILTIKVNLDKIILEVKDRGSLDWASLSQRDRYIQAYNIYRSTQDTPQGVSSSRVGTLIEWVLEYYKRYIHISTTGTYFLTLIKDQNQGYRCLVPLQRVVTIDDWKWCKDTHKDIKEVMTKKAVETKAIREEVKKNLGYQGILGEPGKTDGKYKDTAGFRIVDLLTPTKHEKKGSDKRQRTGRACTSMIKANILEVVHRVKLDYPKDKVNIGSNPSLRGDDFKFVRDKAITDDDKARLIYWQQFSRPDLCRALIAWFYRQPPELNYWRVDIGHVVDVLQSLERSYKRG